MSDQIKNGICPVCGGKTFKQSSGCETIYLCTSRKKDGSECKTAMYYCTKCNKLQPKSAYGKLNGAMVCKTCDKTQWDLTEEERVLSALRGARNSISDIFRNNGF